MNERAQCGGETMSAPVGPWTEVRVYPVSLEYSSGVTFSSWLEENVKIKRTKKTNADT